MKIVTNNITVPLKVHHKQIRIPFSNMKKKVDNKKSTLSSQRCSTHLGIPESDQSPQIKEAVSTEDRSIKNISSLGIKIHNQDGTMQLERLSSPSNRHNQIRIYQNNYASTICQPVTYKNSMEDTATFASELNQQRVKQNSQLLISSKQHLNIIKPAILTSSISPVERQKSLDPPVLLRDFSMGEKSDKTLYKEK